MAARTKIVSEKMGELYALMATLAADMAIKRISEWKDATGAEQWAEQTGKWLDKAGANNVRWTYNRPRMP